MILLLSYLDILSIFFFFSSRRRHTRYWRDWSSDVCSSDLELRTRAESPLEDLPLAVVAGEDQGGDEGQKREDERCVHVVRGAVRVGVEHQQRDEYQGYGVERQDATCRRAQPDHRRHAHDEEDGHPREGEVEDYLVQKYLLKESREDLALVPAVKVRLLPAVGFGVPGVQDVDQDHPPLPIHVREEGARREPRDNRPDRHARRRSLPYGYGHDARPHQGPQMERHQRDLPSAHQYLPEDGGGERHEGHRPPEQGEPPATRPRDRTVGAEDEPLGGEEQRGGEPGAEEKVPGVEAPQRERVDEGEHHYRRDVPRHPEPPAKTAAAASLKETSGSGQIPRSTTRAASAATRKRSEE